MEDILKKIIDIEYKLNSHEHTGVDFTNKLSVESGVYTPTYTAVSNIDGVTAYDAHYIKIGNVVSVAGKVDFNATATGDAQFGISLPFGSNFNATEDCAGTFSEGQSVSSGMVTADTSNLRANVRVNALSASNRVATFIFMYRIIQ